MEKNIFLLGEILNIVDKFNITGIKKFRFSLSISFKYNNFKNKTYILVRE